MEEKQERKKYWLKLDKDFLKSPQIKVIKNMRNGKDYIIFYLSLMLESVETVGHLRFTSLVPYNDEMLSAITDTNIDIVRSATKIFCELGMMQIFDDGTIFMTEVPKITGKECESAERVRRYRLKQQEEKDKMLQCNANVTKSNAYIEEDKEKDKEIRKKNIEKDIEIEKEKDSIFDIEKNYDNKIFEKFWNEYPKKISKGNAEKWFKKNKPTNDLVDLMIEKLKIYKETEQWKKDNGKYIPYPSSWLNAKGWEDEIQSNNIKRKYDTSIVYHDKYIGDYKFDENGRRIFV